MADFDTHDDIEAGASSNAPTPVTRRRSEVRRFLDERANQRQFSARAVVVGMLVGTLVCFSNMYFGLQTGWVSMMSMPSALIGFAVFKSFAKHFEAPFTPMENVLVQTVAVAVGSMPLSAGFVGVIPALERLLKEDEGGPVFLSTGKMIVWSLGVAFFGVFFAVPLRKQVIIREKLKFPSGAATAALIDVLHSGDAEKNQQIDGEAMPIMSTELEETVDAEEEGNEHDHSSWKDKTRTLLYTFALSGGYTFISYFFPIIRDLPVFGSTAAHTWLWTLNPSPAYVGQGAIMGVKTTTDMLLGAIVGWGILSPLAKNQEWAPGPVGDWIKGSRGWIVWVSLAIMLSDSIISLGGLVFEPIARQVQARLSTAARRRRSYAPIAEEDEDTDAGSPSLPTGLRRRRPSKTIADTDEAPEEDAPPSHLVPMPVVISGLILSGIFCILATKFVFSQVPLYANIVAFLLALLLSVMGVRALGATDLNPVSSISKFTQLIFALIIPASNPSKIIINLVAGAVSEAGAQQAGDIMQDLKTGHLLAASPRAQFYGQLLGSIYGAIISAGVYQLYSAAYPIPGDLFQIPTAYVWIDCSRLMFGEGLPRGAWAFSAGAAAIFAVTTVLRTWVLPKRFRKYMPGGIAFAVGMYNVPAFTLARAAGGLLQWWWEKRRKGETGLVILASGLILGEGIVSIVNLALASAGVPHL